MKLERLLPLLLLPGAAHAGGGGGGILLVLLFLPLLLWLFVKIWSFWFRLIFGSREERRSSYQAPPSNAGSSGVQTAAASDLKSCPFCAEPIQRKAIKCKHCRSDLQQ